MYTWITRRGTRTQIRYLCSSQGPNVQSIELIQMTKLGGSRTDLPDKLRLNSAKLRIKVWKTDDKRGTKVLPIPKLTQKSFLWQFVCVSSLVRLRGRAAKVLLETKLNQKSCFPSGKEGSIRRSLENWSTAPPHYTGWITVFHGNINWAFFQVTNPLSRITHNR